MISFVDGQLHVWCDFCWTRTPLVGDVPAGWRAHRLPDDVPSSAVYDEVRVPVPERPPSVHLCPAHADVPPEEIPSAPTVLSKEEREARLAEVGIKLPAK